jgi:hypothetical protein
MLPQQPRRQSTGVIRSTDAALHSSPLTPGVLQEFCEPDTSPLQSAEPCVKRSSHRQTHDAATTSPLFCRSLPSGSSYNPNSPLHIDSSMSSRWDFRPIILPQTGYIRGSPFLRGYGKDLQGYGISSTEFLQIVDEINIANVPNPENQLFQKVASVAGWFVYVKPVNSKSANHVPLIEQLSPGFGALGVVAGQLGAGVASAYGQKTGLSRVLAKANLEVLVPRGLEMW